METHLRRLWQALAGVLVLGGLWLGRVAGEEPAGFAYLERLAATPALGPTDDSDAPLPPESTLEINPASYQPQPPLLPPREVQPPTPPPQVRRDTQPPGISPILGALGLEGLSQSLLARSRPVPGQVGTNVVSGVEAKARVTTDAGNLLGKAPAALGVGVQRRTPIVTDPRIRGSRVGQLAAAGSYWVPARIDLDTAVSKIDSRLVEDVEIIGGPYSALYGPGLHFLDIELLRSPRFDSPQWHSNSSADFNTNGEQWYGRQDLMGGSRDWGFRFGYGHRTGNDYVTGEGEHIPSSYKSRDINFSLGRDLSGDAHLEYNALRLDQTDVEFPGMAFDMDFLVTDAHDVAYILEDQEYFDLLEVEVWYNRTRFEGNAQRPGKRRQFPIFDFFRYRGFTDVDSMSTGFFAAATWGEPDAPHLTAGLDLRQVVQELNEIASGRIGRNEFENANSPLPRSQWTNPGLLVEQTLPLTDRLTLRGGARLDFVATDVIDDPVKLENLGLQVPQSSLADILGTDEFEQSFTMGMLFATAQYELNPHWDVLAGVGHGERAPSLTELYVAQSFMFLLQNGLNTVTGDPLLEPERLTQVDLGLQCDYERFHGAARCFFGWADDYITFENLSVFRGPPAGQVEQVNLKYVNTDLATLNGVELYGAYDLNPHLTPFATLRYVEGKDRTRNGDFATRPNRPGQPSEQVPGLPRGSFSGIAGGDEEPLPGILPLESRLGVRFHPHGDRPHWAVEISARVVDDQERVAASLLETPTPGFTTYDLRGYWRPNDRWLFVSGVENFTDKLYREHLDFRSASGISVYQPGVNFYFGSELSF
ncbi:MAG: TonB-dependent receptor [Pirellulales bacterium]|nr:TonB-dependent receptor [Pirellulales bacterium]